MASDTKATRLKPCLFCGSESVRIMEHFPPGCNFFVQCMGCSSKAGWRYTKGEAIKAWNRRTKSAS